MRSTFATLRAATRPIWTDRSTPLRLLTLAALCCMGANGRASDDQIVTDRPDFVESSNVVGNGRFQIETSIAGDHQDVAGVRTRNSSTPTLLRYGVSDMMEVRLETDGRSSSNAAGVTQRGYADLAFGAKWHLADALEQSPSLGLLLHVDAPSGSRAFRGQGYRPSLRLVAEWELPQGMSLGLMPGVALDRDDAGQRYSAGIVGIVLGKSWTDQWRTFVELAAPRIASTAHGGTLASVDVGAAYLLTKQWQLDVALSRRLNHNTPDLSWTLGISAKF